MVFGHTGLAAEYVLETRKCVLSAFAPGPEACLIQEKTVRINTVRKVQQKNPMRLIILRTRRTPATSVGGCSL